MLRVERLGLRSLFILIAVAGLPSIVLSQSTWIDYKSATVTWTWTETPGAPAIAIVEGFRLKCGRESKVYTVITDILDPNARSAQVSKITNGLGLWFCAMCGFNKYAESSESNEINFAAGAGPEGSIVLSPPKSSQTLKARK